MIDKSEPIPCRSRKSPKCLNGVAIFKAYEDEPIENDGTWDGETVVCDYCYLFIGSPGVPVDHPDAGTFGRRLEGGKG